MKLLEREKELNTQTHASAYEAESMAYAVFSRRCVFPPMWYGLQCGMLTLLRD